VIAFDGEHLCADAGRRDRFATIAVTRSLSTPSAIASFSRRRVGAAQMV
jgi:hypothetical protein